MIFKLPNWSRQCILYVLSCFLMFMLCVTLCTGPTRLLNQALHIYQLPTKLPVDNLKEDQCKNAYTKLCGTSLLYTNLEFALQERASKDKVILLAGTIDKGYQPLAINFFLTSIVKHKICNVLFIAIDNSVLNLVSQYGMPIFHYNGTITHIEAGNFSSEAFNEKSRVKLRVTNDILQTGYAVLVSDLDMFYKTNPIPHIECSYECDMAVQNNTYTV